MRGKRILGWGIASGGAALVIALGAALAGSPRPQPYGWSAPSGRIYSARLHLRTLGRGRPTFLLLHGLAASQLYFGSGFDALAVDGRLIAPDLLGFGHSPRPEQADYSAQTQALALIEALEELEVESPVYVVAHSASALVALRLAVLRPAWIAGMVLFGPALYRSESDARRHLEALGLWTRIFALDTRWAKLACRWMCRFRDRAAVLATWLRRDLPQEVAKDAVLHSWPSYSGTVRNLVVGGQPTRDLDWISAPIRVIVGARDAVVDLPFLEELARTHQNVRLQIWPGDHQLPLSDPERCVSVIRRLIGGEH